MPMFARSVTWSLTTCHVAIVLVANAVRPNQTRQYGKVTPYRVNVMQRSATPTWSGNKDPTMCTEAVMVEPRAIRYTAVALSSALDVPGIDLITFAHSQNNAQFAKQLVRGNAKLERAYGQGFLQLLKLPVGDLGGDAVVNEMPTGLIMVNSGPCAGWHHEYTRLMLSPGFWKLLHCDRVLIFQSDTVFCRASAVKIEEFAAFPYIGGHTPGITGKPGRIHMNGGFSLRSRAAMLQCIEHVTQEHLQNGGLGEDEIYSQCPHLKQPPLELVDRFAIDNAMKVPQSVPLGVHKPWGLGPYSPQVTEMCDGAQALYDAYKVEGC